ncbi:MAG: serine hydrolase domain-containing protein, partial [Tepidiformaceae bacterium]
MIEGEVAPGYEAVREAFERCFTELGETGAGACVYVDGRAVVDLWSGAADSASWRAWERDTLVNVYSVSKPFAATCLLMLIDRGLVELDAPVARYWPEFAQAGKADVPVRWLLTHEAGVLLLREPQPREAIFDWERMTALLAGEAPWWEPGMRHGELAYFFGHLVGEVVRRVDGRTPGQFLRDEIAGPWGLDFAFGLDDAAIGRCATLEGADAAWREELGAVPGSLYAMALDNPPAALYGEVVNSEAWRRAEVPAVNGHGTARGVARFYAGLAGGGELDGVRLLSAGLVEQAVTTRVAGEDVLLQHENAWGL